MKMGTLEVLNGFKEILSKVVKPENIVSDPAILEEYSSDVSFIEGSRPLLLVRPESKDEVKGIVKLANESKMPLVPVSSGTPRFHGDTLPNQSGIIVDFNKMKRIFTIDSVSRSARVEPGVTYGELIPEVRKHGLKLNIPWLPRASKSVVTSRLEREPVLIPKYQYDYVDPLLTLEVVYGTGDEFRTGSASGPGDLEHLKSDMVNPWGPGSVDYYRFISGAQGTMGLVTWAMVKTEVLPSIQRLYFVRVADAGKAAALMINLLRKRIVDECLALNNVNLAAILADDWPGDYKELKESLPPWTVITCVSGYQRRPEERVEIQGKYLMDICDELGLKPQFDLPGAEGKENTILEHLSGCWEKETYWKLAYKGACHDIFFLAPLSKTAGFIELMKKTSAKYRYPYNDIGCYLQPMVQGRGCHCEFNLPCDESNTNEVAEVKSLFLEASETLIRNGAFFSRPYGPWADMVFSRYSEGVTALKKLKDIFDPNNILNPGKLCF
jgi:FAD/FMN-containing dehydrogenase